MRQRPRFMSGERVMIGETDWANDRAKLRELLEKRVGMRDGGDRRQISSLQCVQGQRLPGRSAGKTGWSEVHRRLRYLWCHIRQRAPDILDRGSIGNLAGHNDERRATRRSQRLAPRARGKQTGRSSPRVGIDQNDISVSAGASMLKCIVEDDSANPA